MSKLTPEQSNIIGAITRTQDNIAVVAKAGTGKAQPLDSKILLANGHFKRMGDVKIGDKLASMDGGESEVYGVHPQGFRPTFLIKFGDAREVKADADHLWEVNCSYFKDSRIMRTRDIVKHLEANQGHHNSLYVNCISGEFGGNWGYCKYAYLLGALLGDGGMTGKQVTFTSMDEDIIDKIDNSLPVFHYLSKHKHQNSGKASSYSISNSNPDSYNKIVDMLNDYKVWGKTSLDKFIPEECFTWSKEYRLQLLQGLLDTDGCVDGRNSSVSFSSSSRDLAMGVIKLVRSIGGKAKLLKVKRTTHADHYRVSVSYYDRKSLFFCERKRSKIKEYSTHDPKRLKIVSASFIGQQECQCIAVTHPTRLYITDEYTLTHNTYSLVEICKHLPHDEDILALAFNKTIADELNERLPSHAKAMTLNSIGHRSFQRFIGTHRLKLNREKVGSVLRLYCKEDADLWPYWSGIAQLISKARLHGIVPEAAMGESNPITPDTDEAWLDIISEHDLKVPLNLDLYRSMLVDIIELSFDGEIDFDDQIYMCTCFNVPIQKYDTILVDEAQDLSDMQHRFIDKMMDDSTRIIVVGDHNQAIYAWRGALCDSLAMMIEKYECTEMPLTVSFRCGKSIIKQAQKYVPDIKAMDDAPEGEIQYVEDWDADFIEPNSMILCRNVAPLVRTAYRLIAGGRPACMMGRDIGKGLTNLVTNIIKPAKEISCREFLHKLTDWQDNEINIARSKGQPWREDSVTDKADSIRAVQSYSQAKNTVELIAAIDRLFSVNTHDKIMLSTIHRSKGMEWDTVYFLDKWLVPSKYAKEAFSRDPVAGAEQMQQEHNLCYVAITRAKKKLIYVESSKFKSEDQEEDVFMSSPVANAIHAEDESVNPDSTDLLDNIEANINRQKVNVA